MAPTSANHLPRYYPMSEKSVVRYSNLEEQVSKELKWFYVRYMNNARYLYVDSNYYGIVWPNLILFVVMHLFYFYGLYMVLRIWPVGGMVFCICYGEIAGLGVTTGAHRLWTHRSYEATLPLRIFLCMCHTMAGQNDLYTWVRDHRLHHKFSETDADPHNSLRGMFFAHVGWLLTRKHPDVMIKGRTIDMSDVINDPVVRFQRRFYVPLYIFFRFFIPTYLPMRYMNATFSQAFIGLFGTYLGSLHCTWFVNSLAHWWGTKEYNVKIKPRNNFFVSYITLGEGFHNFHHTFPWDYTIGEFVWQFNPGQKFIEFWAKIGLAKNLKRATPEQVKNRLENARKIKDQN
ncbi:stearoyl-CoA desaturase-like protein, partial [Dinothrombium tinctorium]